MQNLNLRLLLLISILTVSCVRKESTTTFQIIIPFHDFVYLGLENPITIESKDSINILFSNVKSQRQDGNTYLIMPEQPDEDSLVSIKIYDAKSTLISERNLKIVKLPFPNLYVNDSITYANITKNTIKYFNSIQVKFDNSTFLNSIKPMIYGFELVIVSNNMQKHFTSNNDLFTYEMKENLNLIDTGDFFIIKNIRMFKANHVVNKGHYFEIEK